MNASSPANHLRRLAPLLAASAAMILGACGERPGGYGGATAAPAALTQDDVVPTGQTCTPTGKHVEHRAYGCATCHQCEGTLSFDATIAGPNAAFDATTKTCSNVACHSVPAGTFSYTQWDYYSDSAVTVSVPYGGQAPSTPANWYAPPGTTCTVCHDYPPKYNGTAYTWHSGQHGLNMPAGNACQLCHPDATGAYVYGGPPSYTNTSAGLIATCDPGTYCAAPGNITDPSRHANGTVNVAPNFQSACFSCH